MTRLRLLISWLLLLLPTLILGVGALYLLKGEEARLASTAAAAANDRIRAISGNFDLAIAEVEDGLLETLRSLSAESFTRQTDLLEEWKRSNPLVRNVFIWEPGLGLRYPDPERPSSDEEADFTRRYLSLFSSQSAWQLPAKEVSLVSSGLADSVLSERKELRQLAQQAPAPAAAENSGMTAQQKAASGAGHWRPWFADNQLHLLGWYEPDGSPQRLGVEIEMMALLSRLLGNFSGSPPPGETYALLDGNGAVFHQLGALDIGAGQRPLTVSPIASLPHWQIAVYRDVAAGATDGGFFLLASLLVGTFVVAILFGGSLLLWQAHRNQLDARQKTSFVSNVSHELKTPLTTIRMYAEMLAENQDGHGDKQQKYLQIIVGESQRLTRLVNNVLDFSRLEQGRKEFSKEEIDLPALLHQLLDSQLLRIEEAGLQLYRKIDSGRVLIDSDRDALQQILLNLLDNAIKYAGSGKLLTVELSEQQNQWVVGVCDNGPGIPKAHRQQIFSKFHRIDTSLTASQQGSGLGLSIARQLAEGLGGSLLLSAQKEIGACFELNLPKRSAP